MRIGILTVSDRSFRGEREDLSGPALASAIREGWLNKALGQTDPEPAAPRGQDDLSGSPQDALSGSIVVAETAIVPDERLQIAAKLIDWCDRQQLDLVLTTGGTGFAPRDVTPEATQSVLDKLAPGLAEAIRSESLRITAHAMLSRGVAGIRKRTLIVNLPGSPRGAVESLAVILPVLPHAVELLHEDAAAELHHGI